tara:strand:- start:4928 stop:6085 length:1158 start_codon:yes stop_codon:yes gene_type:complete
MKSSFYCITLFIFFACNNQKPASDGDELPSLEISLETVVIDPGEELLFLNSNLSLSALSEDKKYLYNINSKEYTIEQINLNTLAFEKKYRLEKEGPNEVGHSIHSFSLINEDKLFISTFYNDGIFNWQGEKLESFGIKEIGIGLGILEEGDRPYKTVSIASDGSKFASLIHNFEDKRRSFILIEPANNTIKELPIPAIEKAKNYDVALVEERTLAIVGPQRYLNIEEGKAILGTEASSELYVLDKNADSLRHITFNSRLIPNEKSGTYPPEVSSKNQFLTYALKIQKDISYKAPVWDDKRKVYYRFSFQYIFDENAIPKENQLFLRPIGATVYLSVLDKDFNLVAEGAVPELDRNPSFHFAKDGKLWLFENIEDEMGFVRLDINW